jgi:hypothetical protein
MPESWSSAVWVQSHPTAMLSRRNDPLGDKIIVGRSWADVHRQAIDLLTSSRDFTSAKLVGEAFKRRRGGNLVNTRETITLWSGHDQRVDEVYSRSHAREVAAAYSDLPDEKAFRLAGVRIPLQPDLGDLKNVVESPSLARLADQSGPRSVRGGAIKSSRHRQLIVYRPQDKFRPLRAR